MGSVKVPFGVEGEVLGAFGLEGGAGPGGAIAGLWLRVEGAVWGVKLAKTVRSRLGGLPLQGARLRVTGTEKLDLRSGRQEFKAKTLEILTPGTGPIAVGDLGSGDRAAALQAGDRVEFCGKKNCRRRGGEAAFAALEAELAARGLADQVTVTWGGCLKACKAGPAAKWGQEVCTQLTAAAVRSRLGTPPASAALGHSGGQIRQGQQMPIGQQGDRGAVDRCATEAPQEFPSPVAGAIARHPVRHPRLHHQNAEDIGEPIAHHGRGQKPARGHQGHGIAETVGNGQVEK